MGMKIWRFLIAISPIFTTLGSAYLNFIFPLSLSFIPEDKAYGIGLALYSALILLVVKAVDKGVNYHHEQKSIVNVEYSTIESTYRKQDLIYCDFQEDTAKCFANIHLDCSVEKIKNAIIIIKLPVKVDIQPIEEYAKYYSINKKERIISIELKNLVNLNKTKRIKEDTEIGFRVIKNDKTVNSDIETVLENKTRNTRFISNILKFTK